MPAGRRAVAVAWREIWSALCVARRWRAVRLWTRLTLCWRARLIGKQRSWPGSKSSRGEPGEVRRRDARLGVAANPTAAGGRARPAVPAGAAHGDRLASGRWRRSCNSSRRKWASESCGDWGTSAHAGAGAGDAGCGVHALLAHCREGAAVRVSGAACACAPLRLCRLAPAGERRRRAHRGQGGGESFVAVSSSGSGRHPAWVGRHSAA